MSGGLLSLKWNHHRSTFLHILRDIKEKDQFSDVVLACDGKFYNAHKLVLATCSEYFENMFQQTQCKQPVIVLKDISRIELEALLSYMYDGEVNVLQENLSTLIKAAECLKIKGLAVADEDPAKSELISSKRKQLSNDTSSKDNSYRYSSKDSNSERNSRNKRSHISSDDNSSKENLSKKRKESSTSDSEDAVNDNNLDGSDINNVTYQNHEENVKQEPVELSDHDEKLVISQSLEALSNSVQNNSDDSEFRSEKTNSLNINDNRSNDSTANEVIEGKYSDRDDGGDTAANEISSLWLNNEIDDSLSQQAGSSRYNDHSHQLHPAGANKSDSESARMALQTSCSEFLQTSFFDELLSQNVFISDDQLAFAKLSQGPGGIFPNKFLNKSKCQPVKKYNCTWCSYTTMRKDNLNVHIRRHTGERPYACPCCTRSFSDKSNYNVHVRKHAAEGLIPLGDSNSISALVPVTSSFSGLPIHEELFIPTAPKHKNSKQE